VDGFFEGVVYTMMERFTLSEFGGFIVVAGGIVTGLIIALQKSRCSQVDCLCIKCKREVPPVPDALAVAPTVAPAVAPVVAPVVKP
tara:strand:- start:372 stop:629 length:258 start_codon:yes stop_codon:yes gene_type:complete